MKFFRKVDLKYRLIITFMLISIIPLIFLGFYSHNKYSDAIKNKISTSTTQLLSLVNTNMITEIEKYQYLCGSICVNKEIQNALLMENLTSGEKNSIILDIQDIVKTKIIYPAQAKNITIVDSADTIFYDLGYDGFYKEDFQKILENVKSTSIDSWTYVKTYRSRDILVLGRKIFNQFNSSQILGYTLISIDEQLFSKTVLSPLNLQEGSNILFMDSDGTVLSSWDRNTPLGKTFPNPKLIHSINAINKKEGSFNLELSGENYLVTYSYNKNIDKFFISLIPFSYINSEAGTITKDLFLTYSIILLLCMIIILYIYFSISVPIRKMVATCQRISIGNLEERIHDDSNDELSYLSNNIDQMVEKIQALLMQQQEQEQKKRDLELRMLQYQINPHFLFNTLNTLRLVASMNRDMVVSEGIQSLSELLKNTLINKQEYITVDEEIQNLQHYLSILTIRYAGNFHANYEVETDLHSCLVPKLIFQPLAENSVMHGTRNDGSIMEIWIKVYRQDENIVLEVSDNGKGFDTSVEQLPKGLGGFGNKNVNDRIRLNFGEQYGLTITSKPDCGTTCKMLLPKIT